LYGTTIVPRAILCSLAVTLVTSAGFKKPVTAILTDTAIRKTKPADKSWRMLDVPGWHVKGFQTLALNNFGKWAKAEMG